MSRLNNKALSAIVALILFLALSVSAYFVLEGWFTEFSSGVANDYSVNSKNDMYRTDIQGLKGDELYFKNTLGDNLTILDVKVGNKSCSITGNLSVGFDSINLSSCYENVSRGVNEFVVITNQGVFTKTYYLGTSILGLPAVPSVIADAFTILAGPMSISGFTYDDSSVLSNVVFDSNINGIVLDRESKEGFLTVLDGVNRDEGKQVISLSDGSYVVGGYTASYAGSDQDYLLIKFDNNGNKIWSKSVGGSSDDYGHGLVVTSDGGYLMGGNSISYSASGSTYDPMIVKFDSNGVEQWSKTVFSDSISNYFGGLTHLSDGGYAITGQTTSFGGADSDIYLIKFDSNGVEQWSKYIGGSTNDVGSAIIETMDGGFLVTGQTDSYATNIGLILIKFDSNGVEQWTKVIGGSGSGDYGKAVIELDDGSIIVAGYGDSYGAGSFDIYLIKFDSNGVEQWTKTLGGSDYDEALSLTKTYDDGFVVTGFTKSYGGTDNDLLIAKFDINGIEQWYNILDGSGTNDYGYSVIEDKDKNLVITGFTESYGGSDRDLILLKFDQNGELGSFSDFMKVSISEVDQSVTEVNQVISETDFALTEVDETITESDESTTFTNLFNYNSNGYFPSGTYTSKVFDAGSLSNWKEINWNGKTIGTDKPSTFLTTLGAAGSDELGFSVVQTSDGGFAVGGRTNGFGAGDYDALISKFNSDGVELWSKTIGGTNYDGAESMIKTSDDGFLLTGITLSYGGSDNDILISKLDSNGVEEWTKSIGGAGIDMGVKTIEAANGDFIVMSSSQSYGSGGYDILISRLNSSGVEQWSNTIGGSGNDFGKGIIESSDNGIIIGGLTQSYGGSDNDMFLVKLDSSGVEQWTKIQGGGLDDRINDLIELEDNSLVGTGYSQSYNGVVTDFLLVKFDANGVEQWTKTLGGSSSDSGQSIIQTSDGNFVIAGWTPSYGGSDSDFFLSKFNSDGVELWSKVLNGTGTDLAYSVIETLDKNLVITGYTQSYGSGGYDIFLMKVDKDGNLGDWSEIIDLDISESSQTVSEIDQPISEVVQSVIESDESAIEVDQSISYTLETFNPSESSINILARSCDDINCIGENWETLSSNSINQNNRYFQYMLNLTTSDSTKTPEVYNVTIDYIDSPSIIKFVNPTPINNLITNVRDHTINVSITMDEIENVTFKWNGVSQDLGVQDSFVKVINWSSSSDSFNGVVSTLDGGFAVIGTSNSYPVSGTNAMIMAKYDKDGNREFFGYQQDGSYHMNGEELIQLSDGSYILLGGIGFAAADTDSVLAKYDSNGNEVWTQYTGGGDWSRQYHLKELSDGGFGVGGMIFSYSGNSWQGSLQKFDSNGNWQWSQQIGENGVNKEDVVSGFVQLSDGGFLAAGMSQNYGDGPQDSMLYRFDSSGNELWSKYLANGALETSGGSQIINSSDGNFVMIGTDQSFGGIANWYILKIDETGNIIWGSILNLSGGHDLVYQVIETQDKNYVVAGYTQAIGEGGKDILISKFNETNGEILWSTLIGGSGNDEAFGITELNDGSLVVVGGTTSFGGTDLDAFIIKTDKNGIIKNLENYSRPDLNSTTYPYNFVDATLATSSYTPTSNGLVSKSSTLDSTVTEEVEVENTLEIKGTSPNYYFEVEKNNLEQGTFAYSAQACDISSCYETETRSLTTNSQGIIDFVNPTPVDNLITTNRDHTINVSINLENINNISFTFNGVKEDLKSTSVFYKSLSGGISDDRIYALDEFSNGDIITVGYTYESFGSGTDYDNLLVKFDKDGNELWSKVVGGISDDLIYDVFVLHDEIYTYSIFKSYGSTDEDFALSKFDSDGNLLWSKILDSSGNDFGYKMKYFNQSIYVTYNSKSHCGTDDDITVSKFNLSGDEQWTSCLNGASIEKAFDIETDSNGNIYIVGYTQSYTNGGYDLLLIKFNSEGSEIWSSYLGGASNDYGHSLTLYNNSIYTLGFSQTYGSTNTDQILSKFDLDGNEIWTKLLDIGFENYPEEIITVDDGLIILSYYNNPALGSYSETFLHKIDFDGNTLWTTILPDESYATDIIESFDKSLIISHNSLHNYSSASIDFSLNKFDKFGELADYSNIQHPVFSFGSDLGISSSSISWSETSVSIDSTSITPSEVFVTQNPVAIYEKEGDLKGTYPNQYFEIEKNNLGIGTSVYSAEVCSISSCYQTETRTLTTNREDYVTNSILFDGVDDYLSWTPVQEGNRKTWTWSGWIKPVVSPDPYMVMFGTYIDTNNYFNFGTDTSTGMVNYKANSAPNGIEYSNDFLLDFSTWKHFLLEYDTTQLVGSDRVKIWVDGQLIENLAVETIPSQNFESVLNSANIFNLGVLHSGATSPYYFNGYMSEVNFIDGQALTPDNFGEYNQYGKWVPKQYLGNYGQNGFYLNFNNSGNLGKDYSGNENNFNVDGELVQTIDTPENNFAVFTTLPQFYEDAGGYEFGITNGGLNLTDVLGGSTNAFASIPVSSGKYYWEAKLHTFGTTANLGVYGAEDISKTWISLPNRVYAYNGNWFNGSVSTVLGSGYSQGDIIGVALDLDNDNISYYKNGVYEFSAEMNLETVVPDVYSNGLNSGWTFNFGSTPFTYTPPTGYKTLSSKNLETPYVIPSQGFDVLTYTGTSYNTYLPENYIENNHYGSNTGAEVFAPGATTYWEAADTGVGHYVGSTWTEDRELGYVYMYINDLTGNYVPSAIAIDIYDGNSWTEVYTSNSHALNERNYLFHLGQRYTCKGYRIRNTASTFGGGRWRIYDMFARQDYTDFGGLDFSPSLVWIKNRVQPDSHKLFDILRGPKRYVEADTTNIEIENNFSLTSFNLDGFSLGTGANGFNDLNEEFVAWSWKEGSEFGFDIVNYTGDGTGSQTLSHNLSTKPELIIIKNTNDGTNNWPVYHKDLGATQSLYLDLSGGVVGSNWNDVEPDDINFTVGGADRTNKLNNKFITYLFTSIPGYSKIGSYVGNSNEDGPFIYTGFKPKYVMVKSIGNNGGSWVIWDSKREKMNPIQKYLVSDLNNAETTASGLIDVDFVSNGFKLRGNGGGINGAYTYIYIAFADYPLSTN